MEIRRAENQDIPRMIELLQQVLEIHAALRRDLFIPGTTKYSAEELSQMIKDDSNPIFVAVADGRVEGYAFTQIRKPAHTVNMTDIVTLFVDDLCVDENCRGQQIGHQIFSYLKEFAKENGIYHITLNVWSCNTAAERFYEKEGMKPMETVMELII